MYFDRNDYFDDPNEAVAAQMKIARDFLNRVRRAVNYIEKQALGLRR